MTPTEALKILNHCYERIGDDYQYTICQPDSEHDEKTIFAEADTSKPVKGTFTYTW